MNASHGMHAHYTHCDAQGVGSENSISHEVVIHSFMQPGEEFGHAHLEAQLRASFKGPERIHCTGASVVLICYNASTCPRALLTLCSGV
jgi:hypothetical protein